VPVPVVVLLQHYELLGLGPISTVQAMLIRTRTFCLVLLTACVNGWYTPAVLFMQKPQCRGHMGQPAGAMMLSPVSVHWLWGAVLTAMHATRRGMSTSSTMCCTRGSPGESGSCYDRQQVRQ
jgi:hypothetical protein